MIFGGSPPSRLLRLSTRLQHRFNPFNIQLLPEPLRLKLFPGPPQSPPPSILDIAKQHLKNHNIPFEQKRAPAEEVTCEFVPRLVGKDVADHFYKLGVYAGQPWIEMAGEWAERMSIPPIPSSFNEAVGWTFYPTFGKDFIHLNDEPPKERVLVFDCESSWSLSKFPLFAVALGESGWYSWTSPAIHKQSDEDQKLIPFGEANEAQLLIGHNVSFDRAYIKEEYRLELSKRRFIDTMSLHCAVAGLSSQQRPEWNKSKSTGEEDSTDSGDLCDDLTHWTKHGSMNNLADAVKLHCGKVVDKSDVKLLIDATWPSLLLNHQRILQYCARDVQATAMLYQSLWPKFTAKCPHPVTQSAMLMMGSMILPVNKNWKEYISKCEEGFQDSVKEGEAMLSELAQETAALGCTPDDDPWLTQLDWTLIPEKYTKKNHKPIGDERLFKKPLWMKKYWVGREGKCHVTTRSAITPLLLKMQWHGRPVIHTAEHGWCYIVKPVEVEEEMKTVSRRLVEHNSDHSIFKVPHLTEENGNVGSLFAKGYQKAIEAGILSSAHKQSLLTRLLSLNSKWSFWTGYRERLSKQLVIMTNDDDYGFIIPGTIAMGTVTRRAVESTWMTAGNPKSSSAGSEQKAMVQSPPGWSFVGADVDSQELWIASLLGDAQFGEHGATAMGWMTLQGSRKDSTDLHSRTAQILGMRRDDAKIFTYGRIYGAGQKYAASLLSRFNPKMSLEEAKSKSMELYAKTKGKKSNGSYYVGGTESFMFNQLEGIAGQASASTPILNSSISSALCTEHVGDEYLTSRVNWAVQSSAVDYLHLMLVSMRFLADAYKIDLRLAITIHDELRFLVKNGDEKRAAMAMQISNLWVRAMFAHQLGFSDLPWSVAFFSLVDIDKVLRKEPTADCITPTNPTAIPPGQSLNIYELVRELQGLGEIDVKIVEQVERINSKRLDHGFKAHPQGLKQWERSLRNQIGDHDKPPVSPPPAPNPLHHAIKHQFADKLVP